MIELNEHDQAEIQAGRKKVSECGSHGEYLSRKYQFGSIDRWTSCQKCGDEERAREDIRRKEEQRVERIEYLHGSCGIPHKFSDVKAGSPRKAESKWYAAAVEGSEQGPLVLSGTVGSGKTHRACELMRALIDRCVMQSLYVSASDYCRQIRSTWNRNGEFTEDQVLSRYATAPFLMLDDLGSGKAADTELIQELICQRYDSGRMGRTIITTNIAAAGFNAAFGERVADRVREGATLVEMTGASLRRPAA